MTKYTLKYVSKTIFAVGVFTMAVSFSSMTIAAEMEEQKVKTKDYINLSLPGGSYFTPIVISASGQDTVVARVYHVKNKREIQVLQRNGNEWKYLGDQGEAITGQDGNFLKDAIKGPDGRLWILAAYTRPSNPHRGDTVFLYCYENNKWVLKGPPDGYPSGSMGDQGLNFLGGAEPVHLFYGYDVEKQMVVPHYLGLKSNSWYPLPVQKLLRSTQGGVHTGKNDTWVIGSPEGNESTLEAIHIRGPENKDVDIPVNLDKTDKEKTISSIAVSPKGEIVVFFADGDNHFGRRYHPRSTKVYDVLDLAPPPSPETIMVDYAFAPDGALWAVAEDLYRLEVYRFVTDKWEMKYKTTQPSDEGAIGSPRLYFRSDNEPIVTWENHFRR